MGDVAALAVGVALFTARLSSWDGKNQGSWKMVKVYNEIGASMAIF